MLLSSPSLPLHFLLYKGDMMLTELAWQIAFFNLFIIGLVAGVFCFFSVWRRRR